MAVKPVIIVPAKPKSLQVIDLHKAAMVAVAAGNTAKALKLMAEAAAINATISHRSGGEGSEAGLRKYEIAVKSANLKADGTYYRVHDGKLWLLNDKEAYAKAGQSFVIPRPKAKTKTVPAIVTPVKAPKKAAKATSAIADTPTAE